MIDINSFSEVRECEYKDEHYSVRDNGAIMRHPKKNKLFRKKDSIWTFGDTFHNGYLYYCGVPVHRVVATAFHGESPTPQHIVDHIDTNRQNNRPENLRWLTKLENILLNEFTRSKIEYLCGSIENFLQDPSKLDNFSYVDSNFSWMRAVTKEEAAATLMHWKELVGRPKSQLKSDNPIGNWIFEGKSQKNTNNNTPPVLSTVEPSSLKPYSLSSENHKYIKKEEKKKVAEARKQEAAEKKHEYALRRKELKKQLLDFGKSLGWKNDNSGYYGSNTDLVLSKGNKHFAFAIYRNLPYNDSFHKFYLGEEESASKGGIHIMLADNNTYKAVVCGKKLDLKELITNILTDRLIIEDKVLIDSINVRFIDVLCYNCGKYHSIYMITGIRCSKKPYLELYNKKDYYLIASSFDELSPVIVESVQKFISTHNELDILMGEIKERYSGTRERSYTSFGCPHCDAILGSYYYDDMKLEYAYLENNEMVFNIPLIGEGIEVTYQHFVLK